MEPAEVDAFRRLLAGDLADPRVALRANEGRKLAGAFNTGMRHARTAFVAALLADDMWARDAIEVLHRHLARFPGIDFFHSSRVIIDEHDAPISSVRLSRERVTLEDFVDSAPVKHLLCWSRHKALSIGGMDESLNSVGPDDFDFPWTMAEHGALFQAVRECLYLYRDHRECFRLTTHLPLTVHTSEIRRIMQKHGAAPCRIRTRVSAARRSYLRQCLFRSETMRRLKEWWGYDARSGWRQPYR